MFFSDGVIVTGAATGLAADLTAFRGKPRTKQHKFTRVLLLNTTSGGFKLEGLVCY